jgi:hypothetical protein
MMFYAALARRMTAALGLGLLSSAAIAGGYGGNSNAHSAMASQEAQAILAYADQYSDGKFRVRHTEAAGATASTGAQGETGYGYGSSDTQIESCAGAKSWKRSVQRSSGYAENGSATASGFSASFVKVRSGDGKYYIFKGYANTSASAGPGGTSASANGLAKSVGGRY